MQGFLIPRLHWFELVFDMYIYNFLLEGWNRDGIYHESHTKELFVYIPQKHGT